MAGSFVRSGILTTALALSLATPAFAEVIYQQDFETNSQGFSGGSRVGSQGYGSLGFGSTLWRHDAASVLTLDLDRGVRNAVLSFSLAVIDSWDCCDAYGPDRFKVTLDGSATPLLDGIFGNYGLPGATMAPGLSVLSYETELGFTAGFVDTAYTASLNLGDLSAGRHQLSFMPYGVFWQGGDDESFGLDNVLVTGDQAAAVPEPGSLGLATLALAMLGAVGRRGRSAGRSWLRKALTRGG